MKPDNTVFGQFLVYNFLDIGIFSTFINCKKTFKKFLFFLLRNYDVDNFFKW